LQFAALFGKLESARVLLGHGAKPDARDEFGNTALLLATIKKFPDIAELLLSYDADPNIANNKGTTPLMSAVVVMRHTPEKARTLVQQLLDHNADVSARDQKGITALDLAKLRGDPEMIRLLSPDKIM